MITPCILAIDSATGPCSAAVYRDGRVVAYEENSAHTMQSARLIPLIMTVMSQAGTSYGDLTAIACTTGPGSFTGIRVALATARGIRFAANITGLGFSTLQVLAWSARHEAKGRPILAALSAGKGQYYVQGFSSAASELFPARLGAVGDAVKDMAAPAIIVGNSAVVPSGYLVASAQSPRADALAELAAHYGSAGTLSPLYIRPPDAVASSSSGLL